MQFYVEQPHVLLTGVHVSLDHPALRLRSGKRNLQDVKRIDGDAFDQCRIDAIEPMKKAR